MEEKCKNPETKIKNILPDGVKLEDYSDILRRLMQIKRRKEIQSLNPSFFIYNDSNLNPSLVFLSGRVIQVLVNLKYFPRSVALALDVIPKSLYIS